MLAFICPHCQQPLRVQPENVGQRGRCNKCGGRIALIGRADASRPQMASRVIDEAEGTPRPPTPRQRAAAERLGASPEDVKKMDRDNAGDLFRGLRDAKQRMEPPTERQLDYLRRLGMPETQIAGISNKAEASRLIEEWLPPPTKAQLDYLARLGAAPGEINALRTKNDAAELIQAMLSAGG